ncbi:MAG: MurR/RpiR family transcriptional regulator [Selenomonadaceae bacterium]|nr:MurR/RpiR family transcriptional regulator [Selenomonadaceae bacterium]
MQLNWDGAELTPVEKQVCKFIQNYPRIVINLSLEDLSQKCFVSQATIIRLCKKLQCEGFTDFKIKLASELSSISIDEAPILQDLPIAKDAST